MRMPTLRLSLVTAVIVVVALSALPAGAASTAELQQRVEALEKQVAELTAQVKALQQRPSSPSLPSQAVQEKAFEIPRGTSPVLGAKNARLSLVVFTDLQCPFCARVDPMLYEVVADPELKDVVNVVYKQFPLSFHKDARPAAEIALAVQAVGGDKAFYAFTALCFQNQRALSQDDLAGYISQVGLDPQTVLKRARSSSFGAAIDADTRLGQSIGVRGTPSLYLGGWELRTRSVDGVKALIKEKQL